MKPWILFCSAVCCAAVVSGCMSPRAQRYLDACLASGTNAATCEMQAQEVDIEAWQGLGAGLSGAGAAASGIDGGGSGPAITNCHRGGSVVHCTTF